MSHEKLYYYPAADEATNQEVQHSLHALGRVYDVQIVCPGHILQDYYELPCIETEEGRRVRGIDSIQRFADKHVKI